MWNHIRGPPFVNKGRDGGVAYIHNSSQVIAHMNSNTELQSGFSSDFNLLTSQGQFVLETYFVMVIYGLIVCGNIMLIEAGDSKGEVRNRASRIIKQKSIEMCPSPDLRSLLTK